MILAKKYFTQLRLITLTALSLSYVLVTLSPMAKAESSEELDRALIQSLKSKDLKAARKHLENGADPEAILGKKLNDNAVCTALDDRSSKYFELLVEFGASTNAYWTDAHSTQRTPLVCAIEMWNFEAFEYLLENGADPSIDLYPEALEKFRNWDTALSYALGYRAFPMALELVRSYELHPHGLSGLAWNLENTPYDGTHPWNYARDALIEWTKQRVPEFNPLPAAPVPDDFVPTCLFTSRDRAEGLKKGTICPPSETQ